MWKKLTFFGLIFLFIVVSLPLASSAPVSDLNLYFVDSPPFVTGSPVNFGLSWTGDANFIYLKFDSDGNTLISSPAVGTNLFDANFNDGTISPFSVDVGSWNAGSFYLTDLALGGGQARVHATSNITDFNQLDVNFGLYLASAGSHFIHFISDTIDLNGKGYRLLIDSAGVPYLDRADGGGSYTNIVTGNAGDMPLINWTNVNILRSTDGNWSLYIGGNYIGSGVDIDYNDSSYFVIEFRTLNARIDDISITGSSPYEEVSSPETFFHTFSNGGLKTVQATVQNPDGNVSTSLDFNVTLDTVPPVITISDFNYTGGFFTGSIDLNANYAIGCTDNNSTYVDMNIMNGDVNITATTETSGTTVYVMAGDLIDGVNRIKFNCTDASGNTTTDTNNVTVFSKYFYLVYSDTGVSLVGSADYTASDVNFLQVYSYNLQTYKDLFSTGEVSVYYIGSSNDGILFKTTYTDPAYPAITQDFDLIALDTNSIPVCFMPLQPFYEQLVYSTKVRQVKIINAVTGCYNVAAYADYAYQDAFKISAFTTPGAYNMYYKSDTNSLYTFISLLSGNFAAQHNLDLLIINALEINPVEISQDVLTVSKYCQVSDCNVLSVTYKSVQNNSDVTISILNGSTVLTSTTATSPDANNVTFTWNYTTSDVNADFLTIKAEITRANGDTETITQLFTLNGIQGFLDPTLAIILAFGFFFFMFTVVASRFALGWFGIIGVIGALAILSSAPGVQFILLAEAIMIVIGAVIFFTWKNETAKAI